MQFPMRQLAAVFAAMVPSVALAVTPVNGGAAGGTTVVINNDTSDHSDPHVSGDLAAYTEGSATRSIHYYRFSIAADSAVPSLPGATDSLSDIRGNKIVFSRSQGGCDAIMIFDVSTLVTNEVAPGGCAQRLGAAIGNTTIAYTDFGSGSGVTFAADLAGGAPTQLSSGAGTTQNAEVASDGNAVVWEQCSSLTNCDVMKSIRSAGVWGAAAMVVASSSNPDTDGTNVVYDSNRAGNPTGRDIYFQPLAGGAETQLQIAGEQSAPSIYAGVIGFESRSVAGAPADIFIYVIATNTMYQLTNTPTIDDHLNDVTVLPTGEVRIVWTSNDGLFGVNNVYGRTFTVPLDAPPTCDDGNDDNDNDDDEQRGNGEHHNGAHCDAQHNNGPHHDDDHHDDDGHSHGDLSSPPPATSCSAAGDLAPFTLVLVAGWLSMPKRARAPNSRRS